MPKPKVIETLELFRKEVMQKEKDMMILMTRRWRDAEKAIEPQIRALSVEIESLRLAGKAVTPDRIYRLSRYKALLAQVQSETAKYETWAARNISYNQRTFFELGSASSQAMLRDVLPPGININFNRIPVAAVENMIGLSRDGSPLFSVLQKRALYPDAVDRMTTQMINAMALGYNPRKTAEMMKDGLAAGLNKALVIARTEQLRAYREATYQNYNANQDIVKGWVWHSACDDRTCAACWAMHGTVHALDERLDDHVCGRCAMVPVTKTWAEMGYAGLAEPNTDKRSGEEIFGTLDEERQRSILGAGRFDLWQSGDIEFRSMAKFTDDDVWGRSLRVTPIKDLEL
jgi:SPP1 gp7 family putative phage head morphogenesis protein